MGNTSQCICILVMRELVFITHEFFQPRSCVAQRLFELRPVCCLSISLFEQLDNIKVIIAIEKGYKFDEIKHNRAYMLIIGVLLYSVICVIFCWYVYSKQQFIKKRCGLTILVVYCLFFDKFYAINWPFLAGFFQVWDYLCDSLSY